MPKMIFIILSALPFIQCGSTQGQFPVKINKNTAICEAFFSKDGQEKEFGTGIILSDEYIVTCYHWYTAFGKYSKPLHILVHYNFRDNGSSDSVVATGDFPTLPNQYPFSTHHWDPKDYSTDVIVLKLSKKINATALELPNYVASPSDPLYSIGIHSFKTNGVTFINTEYASFQFVVNYYFTPKTNPIYIGSLGVAKEGYSGAGLFNAKGQILGMIQFGWNNWSTEIDDFHSKGSISDSLYNTIKLGYSRDQRIGFAIDFGWLIDNYLSGYMHLPYRPTRAQ
jgi:hypothetical protein